MATKEINAKLKRTVPYFNFTKSLEIVLQTVGSLVSGEASNKTVPQFLAVLFYFPAALTKVQTEGNRSVRSETIWNIRSILQSYFTVDKNKIMLFSLLVLERGKGR